MSQHTDKVRAHPVWEIMRSLGAVIDQAAQRDADPSVVEDIERARAVLAFVGKRLDGIDPNLLIITMMGSISDQFVNTRNALQAYTTDGNLTHITNVQNYCDNVLGFAGQLHVILTPKEVRGLSQAVAEFRASLDAQQEHVRKSGTQLAGEMDTLRARVGDLATDVATQKTNLTNLSSEWQGQFATAQGNRATEFDAAQGKRTTEFDAAQSTRADSFQTAIDQYRTNVTEQKGEAEQALIAAKKRYRDDADQLHTEYEESAKELLARVVAVKGDVEAMAQVVTELGLTNGYLKTANHARTMAYVWQAVTMLSFGGLTWFAYRVFEAASQQGAVWQTIVGRIVVTLVIGLAAAYASKQGDKFFETDRRNRKRALELAALGPFIEPLEDTARAKFRMDIGDRTFGREEPLGVHGEASPTTLLHLVNSKEGKQILDLLTKLAEK